MKENWYALFLSVVKNFSVDKALIAVYGKNSRVYEGKRSAKRNIPGTSAKKEFDYIDNPVKLIELKKTHTYYEIAKMYGTYPDKVYRNIKHYKQSVAI